MLVVNCASQVVLVSQLIAAPPSLPRTLAPLHASLTLLLFTAAATTTRVLIGDPCQRLEPGRARCAVGVAVGSRGRSARARAVGRRVERGAHDDVSSRASDVYRSEFRSDQSTKQVRCCLVFVYAAGGKPGRRGCSIRGERVASCLLCLLRAILDGYSAMVLFVEARRLNR